MFTTLRMTALWSACVLVTGCAAGTSDDSQTNFNRESSVLRVAVDGLGVRADVEFELPPGHYSLEASGHADSTTTYVDLTASNSQGELMARGLIVADNSASGGHDGATGRGSVEVTVWSGQVANVTLLFAWNGQRPDSAINVGIGFGYAPDIISWSVVPAPEVMPGDSLSVEAVVVDHSGSGDPLDVAIELAGTTSALWFDSTLGVYRGQITAPIEPAPYPLFLHVHDADGNSTSAAKTLQVIPADSPNPVDDVAAILAPSAAILFVMPSEVNGVLGALSAVANPDGTYAIPATNGTMINVTLALTAYPATDAPQLILQDANTRVYKNALCRVISNTPFMGPCLNASIVPASGGRDYSSLRYEMLPYGRCVSGDNYCVERSAVIGIWYYYDRKDCAGAPGTTKNDPGFSCH